MCKKRCTRAPQCNTQVCSDLTGVWISDLCTAGMLLSIFVIKLSALSEASWNSALRMTSMCWLSGTGAGRTKLPKVLRAKNIPVEDRTEGTLKFFIGLRYTSLGNTIGVKVYGIISTTVQWLRGHRQDLTDYHFTTVPLYITARTEL